MELNLGKVIEKGRITSAQCRIPADDMMTHCVICGSTGSGKTVLGKLLIEEAARCGIPSVIIDLKGDLSAMAIPIGTVNYTEFEPWIDSRDEDERRKTALEIVETYKSSMKKTGVFPDDMEKFRNGVDIRIYTPRAKAGEQVSLSMLGSPPAMDGKPGAREVYLNMLSVTAAFILERIYPGINPDNLMKERAFMETIIEEIWKHETELTGKKGIVALIREILTPRVQRIGVFKIDEYLAPVVRREMAMRLNSLLVGAEALWYEGTPINSIVEAIDCKIAGRTKVAIFNLSFLERFGDRNMVVSQLGFQIFNHFRKRVDSIGPRVIFYIDEIGSGEQSYFPVEPFYNSSKAAINLLLRQGRAFGICTILSTQNPGDIDYKGLTNCHTWFVGKLLTAEDRSKVIEGIAAEELAFEDVDDIIKTAETGAFLLKRRNGVIVRFQERWLFTFHKVISHDEFDKIHKAIEEKQTYLDGIYMLENGKFNEAKELFTRALQRDPKNAKAFSALGRTMEEQKDIEGALLNFEKSREISVMDDNCWVDSARILRTLGRIEEALKYFAEATRLNRENVEAWYCSGSILFTLGRLGEADAALREALKHNTRHPGALYVRGLVNEALEHLDLARDYYQKAIALVPSIPIYHDSLGDVLFRLGQFILAIESYEISISIDCCRLEPRFGRSRVFVEIREYDKALVEIEGILAIDPAHREARALKAEMAWRSEDYTKAEQTYAELLAENPDDIEILKRLGLSKYRKDSLVGAVDDFKRYLAKVPGDREVWCCLADALDRAGDIPGAIEAYSMCEELEPGNTEILKRLARLTVEAGSADVLRWIIALREVVPDDQFAAFHAGRLLLATGDDAGAATAWETVTEEEYLTREFHLDLYGVYKRIGQWAKTLDSLTRALRLKSDLKLTIEKGRLYHRLGRYDDALDIYDLVAKQTPEDPELWYERSVTFAAMGVNEKSDYCINEARKFGWVGGE